MRHLLGVGFLHGTERKGREGYKRFLAFPAFHWWTNRQRHLPVIISPATETNVARRRAEGKRAMNQTIHAVFENGVFRPTEPVDLPERCEVEVEVRQVHAAAEKP